MNDNRPVPPAPRNFSAWLIRLRRLLAVPVAVALMLGSAGLAYGAFTARTTASLSVATYTVPAPASVNGTLHCTTNSSGQRGAVITFSSIGPVDRATGYRATLTPPGGSTSVVPISGEGQFQITMYSRNGKGQYTFALSAQVASWTGPELKQYVWC